MDMPWMGCKLRPILFATSLAEQHAQVEEGQKYRLSRWPHTWIRITRTPGLFLLQKHFILILYNQLSDREDRQNERCLQKVVIGFYYNHIHGEHRPHSFIIEDN